MRYLGNVLGAVLVNILTTFLDTIFCHYLDSNFGHDLFVQDFDYILDSTLINKVP